MLVIRFLFILFLVGNYAILGSETEEYIETADWFSLVNSVGPVELSEHLASLLKSSGQIFEYKLYRSPSRDGISYSDARSLCLVLGSFPAIILSEEQHAEVRIFFNFIMPLVIVAVDLLFIVKIHNRRTYT